MAILYMVVLGVCFAPNGTIPMIFGAVAGLLLGSMMEG